MAAVAGSAASVDVKGNMTLIPSTARPDNTALGLSWDMDNRLKSADVGNNGSAEVTYQFDALGRRVARTASGTTTVYVQSGQQTIADYTAGANSSSPLYRYVYASYIDEPVLRYQPTGAQSVYYHRNQQYSITALTNASGAILERYAYTAYGTPTITNGAGTVLTSSAHNNRYTYTGREWDDTISLYHYRARMYDPELGRFCGRDPIGYRDSDCLYENCFLRNGVDPSGLSRLPVGNVDPGGRHRGCPSCNSSMKCHELMAAMTCHMQEFIARVKDWDRDQHGHRQDYQDHIRNVPYFQNGFFARTRAYQRWYERAMQLYNGMVGHQIAMQQAKRAALKCFTNALTNCGCPGCPTVPRLHFAPIPELPTSPSNVRYQPWRPQIRIPTGVIVGTLVVGVIVVGGVAMVASGGSAAPVVLAASACAVAAIPAVVNGSTPAYGG